MPRESLDAPEDLPKEAPRQMAFGKLEDKVPGMSDEAPALAEFRLSYRRAAPWQASAAAVCLIAPHRPNKRL